MQTDTPRANAATARARRAYVLALWRLQPAARPSELVFMINELAGQLCIPAAERAGMVGVFLAAAETARAEMVENANANRARIDAQADQEAADA